MRQIAFLGLLALTLSKPVCFSKQICARQAVVEKLRAPNRLELSDATIQELADAITAQHRVPVLVDVQAIQSLGVDLDRVRLGLNVPRISLRAALLRMLAPYQLTYAVQFESLVITSQAEAEDRYCRRVVYDVTDLFPKCHKKLGEQTAHSTEEVNYMDLIHVIMQTVRPETWSAGSGQSQDMHGISLRGKHLLVIRQTEHGHMELENFFSEIRSVLRPPN